MSESHPVAPVGTVPPRAFRHWWRIVVGSLIGLPIALLCLSVGVAVTGFGSYVTVISVAFTLLIVAPLFTTLSARRRAIRAGMILTGEPFPASVERSARLARMPSRSELEGALLEAYRECTVDKLEENPERLIASGWLDRAAGYTKFEVVVSAADAGTTATVHCGDRKGYDDGVAYFFVDHVLAALQWRCATPVEANG